MVLRGPGPEDCIGVEEQLVREREVVTRELP
jgi:hypothetical protein